MRLNPELAQKPPACLAFFLEKVQMIFPVLSFGFLQPKPTVSATTENCPCDSGTDRQVPTAPR